MPSHRRKNVAHQPTTRNNIPKEKKKLLVLSYLIKLGKNHRANKNQIGTYAQKTTQQRGDFEVILGEMVAMEWIEFEEREDNHKWYTFTQKGMDALTEAKRLVNENHPLAELDTFQDIFDF